MNCDEIEDLAGAYALGALPEVERTAVYAHLATCERHPEMRELEAAAVSLALAVDEVEPPPTLRSRLMAAIEAEGAIPQHSNASSRRGFGETIRSWLVNPRLGYGLATALAIVVLGLLVWNISLQESSSNHRVINLSGTASGRLIYLQDQQLAVMEVHGLAPLSADKVYEVWAMTPGSATPIGLLTPTVAGVASLATSLNATGVAQVGVTIEQAPGSDQPTTPPVILANFS